jgi:Pectate lyase superfamily protein
MAELDDFRRNLKDAYVGALPAVPGYTPGAAALTILPPRVLAARTNEDGGLELVLGNGADVVADLPLQGAVAAGGNIRNVMDYGALGDGSADDTAAFDLAQEEGNVPIYIPPGDFVLTNFRPKTGVAIHGAGTSNTILRQGAGDAYCVNMLSDADTGQLLGNELTGVCFIGHPAASVHAMNMEANGVYAIRDAVIDVRFYTTYGPLRMDCPTAGAIYRSKVTFESHLSTVGCVLMGTYNEYDVFITGCDAAYAINDTSSGSLFKRMISEAGQYYAGQRNVIINAEVENWTGGGVAADNIAINNAGYDNIFISPAVVTVPNAKCQYGFKQNATPGTFIGARIVGPTPDTLTPHYPLSLEAGSLGTVIGFTSDCPLKLEAFTGGPTMSKWAFLASPTLTGAGAGGKVVERIVPVNGGTSTFADATDVLLLNNATTLATHTIVMPANPTGGKEVTVSTTATGAITALTVNANTGHSIYGAPTTLPAPGGHFSMIFDSLFGEWYRSG